MFVRTKLLRACAAVLALVLVVPEAAAAGPKQTDSTQTHMSVSADLDLEDPEAAIGDPVADVDVLDRNCTGDQVDVNTATVEEIAERFGLDSSPTVERIVEGRPWLTPSDLVSVPGVPPVLEPTLVTDGCATPLTVPEPAPSACTSSEQVDLQVASVNEIRRELRLPRVTAEAIVAHRPVPQDLTQIVAPRTRGFGVDVLDRLRAEDSVCVTPVPTTYDGVDHRFVYPHAGGVVTSSTHPDYALIVPPGAVEGNAVAEVTPLPDEDLPTADFHIYGTQLNEVAVRLPDISQGDPLVFHDADDGLRVSWGKGTVSEAGGTVVASASSLSTLSSSDRELVCQTALQYSMAVACTDTDPRDQLLTWVVRELATATAGRMNREPAVNGECTTVASRLLAEGSLPVGLHCSGTLNPDPTTSEWMFTNFLTSTLADGWIESFGAVYQVDRSGPAEKEYGSTPSTSTANGKFSGPAGRYLAGEHGLVIGGHAYNLTKAQSTPATSITGYGANMRTLDVAFVLFNIGAVLDSAAAITQIDLPWDLQRCAGQIATALDGGSVGDAADCAKNIADDIFSAAILKASGNAAVHGALVTMKATLSRSFVGLTIANYGSSLFSKLATLGSWNDQTVTVQHVAPPPPVGGGGGSGSGQDGRDPGSLALDGSGTFIARTSGGQAWLVDQNGLAREIESRGDFRCYASRVVVVDYITTYETSQGHFLRLNPDAKVAGGFAPSCSVVPFRVWDYEPSSPDGDGNTPRNVILRGQFDGETHPSWLINSAGQIQTIPKGGDYECLVLFNPVLWDVPFDKVEAWEPVGTEPATCG